MADIDPNSATWQAVAAWAAAERDKAVGRLITGGSSDDKLRGDIRTLDALLTLPNGPPPVPPAAQYD